MIGMARKLFLLGSLLGAVAGALAGTPSVAEMLEEMNAGNVADFPRFPMASRFATQEPMDLYGLNPSHELIANKSSWGVTRLAPPTQKWRTNHTRFLPAPAQVLAYVTPWNQPAGRNNAEHYRGKLDLVAPAWYSVAAPHVDDTIAGAVEFPIGGGFPEEEDRAWVKRLQTPTEAPDGQPLEPIKVVPRFLLEGWQSEDDNALSDEPGRAASLAQAILEVIKREGFDGAVLEATATWRAPQGIAMVGDALEKAGKMLVVVFPPFREGEDAITTRLGHAVRVITPHVSLITVMTYDHVGVAGAPLDLDKYNVPADSPLRTDAGKSMRQKMRMPAPNQPRTFIETNLNSLLGQPEKSEAEGDENEDDAMGTIDEQIKRMGGVGMADGPFGGMFSQKQKPLRHRTFIDGLVEPEDAHKVLIGMPLYGYTFPIVWINQKTGHVLPRVPPAAPPRARQRSSIAASKARAQGERKEKGKVPMLRAAGQPMVHHDLLHWFTRKDVRPLLYNDPDSYEAYFDYLAAGEEPNAQGTREGIYWRAYVPSAYTMLKRRETLEQWPGAGAALWELGQAGPWLLHSL